MRPVLWARFSPVERQAIMSIGLVALVVGTLFVLAYLGFETLSSARAYVNAEGLWSKAQKSAVGHLSRFAYSEDPADYDRFVSALQVTLGDRQARLELDSPHPDHERVRAGFLQGQNDEEDIERLATFFRRFRHVAYVDSAIAIWERGDRRIDELLMLGARLRAEVMALSPDQDEVRDILSEITRVDAELTALERAFSAVIGEGARWVQRVFLGLVVGAGGSLLVLFGLALRTSTRRIMTSEASLRRSEETQRHVLDTIDDGYYETDLSGYVTEVNPALCRILGRDASEIVGRGAGEFFRWRGRPEPPDGTGGRILAEVTRPDGSSRVTESAVSTLTGDDGSAVGHCALVRDVTERLEREDALRRSEAEYRALFEHARYGVFRATPTGRLTAANPALVSMLGHESTDTLLQTNLGDLHADPLEAERLLVEWAATEGALSGMELQWQRRVGTPILVRLNGRTLRDATGGLEGFEMFVEDLSASRALEAQLRHAQKLQAVGELTGGIAHDFNNLLTIIASTADLLAADLPPDAEHARAGIDEMRHAARRGGDMIRKLLVFSRRGYLRFETVNLDTVVDTTVDMLRRMLPANIEIRHERPSTPVIVRADPGAIEQVLLNLATNARDAMPTGGRLSIRTRDRQLDAQFCSAHGGGRPGRYAELTVRDTGSGMDAATRDRIFEPFFTTKPPGAGTGLGMSMIYGLVRQHDGFIDLDSEPGEGTTFHLYLPASVGTIVARERRETEPRGGRETILLVEDEQVILDMGRRILERHGYTVLVATNGEQALELIRERGAGIDLVLTDVVMPRMGARGLHDAVRTMGHPIRFLLTSGYTERDVSGMLDPALPLLPKPWTASELLHRVRSALDGPAPISSLR